MVWLFYLLGFLWALGVSAQEIAQEEGMLEWVQKGDFYLEQGRLELALAEYEKALSAGAGSAPFLNRISAMYMQTGQFPEALNALRSSLKEEPGQLVLYSRIGEAHLAMGQLDSAIASVDYARKLLPDNSAVHSALAFLLLQDEQLDLAKAHLDTSLSLDGNNPEAHRLLGFYNAQGDSIERAIFHYEKLAELVPRDVEGFNNIAFLHSQQQRYLPALEYYKKAKERSSDPFIKQAISDNMEAVRAIIDGKMRARYILVKTETAARDIHQRLHAGEEFAPLAQQFSLAPNAQDGGDLGFFGPGELLPVFEEAVVQLAIGALSEVLSIPMGYVIIQRLN
jgi:tetratricopeptide (TPR) repeat protein